MKLTAEQLKNATGCTPGNAAKYLAGFNAALAKYAINTPLRVAHFLAQIGHESIGLSATREGLNYTVDKLLSTFGRHRITEADARKFGRIPGKQNANQSALANLLYGGEFGRKNLGNTQAGDGWKYRGNGPMQITGRTNHAAAGKALELDLLGSPELLALPENYASSAAHFWHSRNLNKVADLDGGTQKAGEATVVMLTRIINGGSNGLADRQARFTQARKALGIPAPLKVPA